MYYIYLHLQWLGIHFMASILIYRRYQSPVRVIVWVIISVQPLPCCHWWFQNVCSFSVFFNIYDMDKDGYISNGELFQVLKMMVGWSDTVADKWRNPWSWNTAHWYDSYEFLSHTRSNLQEKPMQTGQRNFGEARFITFKNSQEETALKLRFMVMAVLLFPIELSSNWAVFTSHQGDPLTADLCHKHECTPWLHSSWRLYLIDKIIDKITQLVEAPAQ